MPYSMEAFKPISNHENEIYKFFGEHTIVTPPRSGFKEALIKELAQEYVNSSDNKTSNISFFFKKFSLLMTLAIFFLSSFGIALGLHLNNLNYENLTSNNRVATSLTFSKGLVQVKDPSGNWEDLEKYGLLEEGHFVRVNGEGKAVITMEGKGDIRLNSDSQIFISSLKSNHVRITNEGGEVYTRIESVPDLIFEIVVEDTTYESQGTAFKTVNTDKKKGVEVYENNVKVKKNNSEDVVVDEGKTLYSTNTEDPTSENIVKDIEITEVASDSFVIWNKDKDEEKYEDQDMGILTETDEIEPSIEISAESIYKKGIKVITSSENLPEVYELRLILSSEEEPILKDAEEVYPINETETIVAKLNGENYYINVCILIDGICTVYSNTVNITAPFDVLSARVDNLNAEPEVSQIFLNIEELQDRYILSWNLDTEDLTGIKSFRVLYDRVDKETGEVKGASFTIDDLSQRTHEIFKDEVDINSFVKICIINLKKQCYLESNTIYIVRDEPEEGVVDNTDQNVESNDSIELTLED